MGDAMEIPERVQRRFWAKVDRRGDNECWPWKASKNPRGYGFFGWGLPGQPRLVRAHRVAGVLGGTLASVVATPDALALHSCDNPSCCNPAHIRSGTQKDNIAEATQRHRRAPQWGTHNPSSRLGEDETWAIRRLATCTKLSQRLIAGVFGVDQSHVSRILSGQSRVNS